MTVPRGNKNAFDWTSYLRSSIQIRFFKTQKKRGGWGWNICFTKISEEDGLLTLLNALFQSKHGTGDAHLRAMRD